MKNDLKKHITDFSVKELIDEFKNIGEPRYRAIQAIKWIFQKRVDSFDDMLNIPKTVRAKLSDNYSVKKLVPKITLVSQNKDAVKFGFKLYDGGIIESVILYDGKRRTACLSSQLGCNLGCTFCETGRMGFIRNLKLSEIIGQMIAMNDYLNKEDGKTISNIVFMGMGEALLNYNIFEKMIEYLRFENAFNLSSKRITVSTAGVIPAVKKLLDSNLDIYLAVSLNSYNNEKRNKIMPINKKYPIESVVEIAKQYAISKNRATTFEYVLVKGENDTKEAIKSLTKLLHGVPCLLNIIPVNPGGANYTEPDWDNVVRFSKEISKKGIKATVRKSRGRDISGACGQLSGTRGIYNE